MAKSAVAQTEDTNMGRPPLATTQATPTGRSTSLNEQDVHPTKLGAHRLLSKLKFSDLKRSASVNIADPVIRARTKLVDGIKEQILHVQAEIKGERYEPT